MYIFLPKANKQTNEPPGLQFYGRSLPNTLGTDHYNLKQTAAANKKRQYEKQNYN